MNTTAIAYRQKVAGASNFSAYNSGRVHKHLRITSISPVGSIIELSLSHGSDTLKQLKDLTKKKKKSPIGLISEPSGCSAPPLDKTHEHLIDLP